MTLAKFNYKYIIFYFLGGNFAKFTAPHYIAIPPRAMMFVCECVCVCWGGGVVGGESNIKTKALIIILVPK